MPVICETQSALTARNACAKRLHHKNTIAHFLHGAVIGVANTTRKIDDSTHCLRVG